MLNTVSIQRINKIAHLRTGKHWKTAATLGEDTGVKTVGPMKLLL